MDVNKLVNWSNGNGIAVLLLSAAMLFGLPLQALALVSGTSFALLIFLLSPHWTPDRQFGVANSITLLRLLLILGLLVYPSLRPIHIIILALLVFTLDGLDGWAARKLRQCSEFGEYFDKETDALFILVLCWLLYLNQRLAWWILFPGLLRYLFVVFLLVARPPCYKEPQTRLGKTIFAFTVITLIFCFSEYRFVYQPLAAGMSILLGCSFAATVLRIYRVAHG